VESQTRQPERTRKRAAGGLNVKRALVPVTLAVITFVGAALRAHQLGFRLLWLDEGILYWIAQGSLTQVLHQNAVSNSAPPLFPVWINLVSHWFDSEAALRALPWAAGTLAVPAMYFLGRQFLSPSGALIGSLLMATAAIQIEYSQEMREYSLGVLLVVLLLASFMYFVARPTWRRAALLTAVAAVALFSQYGLALFVLALNAVMAIHLLRMQASRKELLVKWVVVQCVLLVVAAAIAQMSLRGQWQTGGFYGDEGQYLAKGYWTGGGPQSALSFAYRGSRSLVDYAYPGLAFAWMFYTGALAILILRRRTLLPFIVVFPFCAIIAAALLRLYPYLAARQDLVLTPLIYLVVATGIDYVISADRRLILLAVVLVTLLRTGASAVVGYYGSGEKDGLGTVLRPLINLAEPGEPIYVCNAQDPVISYYFDIRYPQHRLVGRELGLGPRDYLDQVDRLVEGNPRTWLLLDITCGEIDPLLDHLRGRWEVEPIEERPTIELFSIRGPS
jgi:uncharacterized membrane protein